MFLISSLGQYLNRHIIEFEKQRVVSLKVILFLVYTIFITPLVFFAVAYFEIQEKILDIRYVFIACACYFFANTLNQVSIRCLNILGRSKEFVFYSLLTQGLILVQISLFSMVGLSYVKCLFCLIVSNFIVGFCAIYSLLDGSQKDLYFKDRRDHWLLNISVEFRKAWGFVRHLLIGLVCIWIYKVGFKFELIPFVVLAFLIQEFLTATPTIFEAFIILMMAAVASFIYWIYLVKTIIIEIVNFENIKNA